MGIGGRVGLLVGIMTAIPLLVLALPTLRGSDSDSGVEAFHAAGLNAAFGFGAGLGGSSATPSTSGAGSPTALKLVEKLAAMLEDQVKLTAITGDARTNILGSIEVLKSAAGGKSILKVIDAQLDQMSELLQKYEKDRENDKKTALRDAMNQLKDIRALAEGAVTEPAAGPATAGLPVLARPDSSDPYVLLYVWWRDVLGRPVAQSDNAVALPGVSQLSHGFYPTTAFGRPATVFFAPAGGAGRVLGKVYVAFADPPATSGGGGSKLPLVMLILGPLLVGGIGFAVASGYGKPLKDLARELDRLGSSGDPTRRIGARGPEANAIARSVERMVANLKFRDQHQMTDLQEVVSKEQGAAAEIHHGLMPKDPPRLAGYEVETLFKPGFEIGGDHFDYFRIDESHLGVILMDTSVRGIPAAIIMSMARAYVRSVAPGVLSPAEVLSKVNRLLAADLSQGQWVTAIYAVIDTSTGTAKLASAGHLPLIVYRHAIGKTAVVNPEGIALGLDAGPHFDRSISDVEIEIGVGDRLVLHTDGAVKVQNGSGDEFGEARLYETIKQKAPMNSQAFVNFVGSAIDVFHAETPQNDDITISTVKRLK
jgi:serine phosphatase RsbU (regulator of sigma subunit)